MKERFALKMNLSDLSNNNSFKRRGANSIWHGTELLSYLGSKIWDLVTNDIKESQKLDP